MRCIGGSESCTVHPTLLQYPLTTLGLHALGGNFMAINVAQVIILMPLFIFCYFMYR